MIGLERKLTELPIQHQAHLGKMEEQYRQNVKNAVSLHAAETEDLEDRLRKLVHTHSKQEEAMASKIKGAVLQ